MSDLLPWLLVFGAIGSQLAASVSNVAGGGSLLVETVGPGLPEHRSYQLTVVPAIALLAVFMTFIAVFNIPT